MNKLFLVGLISVIVGILLLLIGIGEYKKKGLKFGILEFLYFSTLGLFESSSLYGLLMGPILIFVGIILIIP